MSLREKLEEHWRQTQSLEIRENYESLVAQLAANGMIEASLKTGDAAPEFLLPNADGRLIGSEELLERGPVVLCFFRGGWCPYCVHELCALREAAPEIEARGASLVAITPDTGAVLAAVKRDHQLNYQVLSDLDHGLALHFGIVFKVPETVRDLYLRRGIDLGVRHGNHHGWLLPVPATYIVDSNGIIRHADIDPDFRKRMEPSDIVHVLDGLGANPLRSDIEVAGKVENAGEPQKNIECG
jgi:peroxiredoxin